MGGRARSWLSVVLLAARFVPNWNTSSLCFGKNQRRGCLGNGVVDGHLCGAAFGAGIATIPLLDRLIYPTLGFCREPNAFKVA